jgi:hypothetical protein
LLENDDVPGECSGGEGVIGMVMRASTPCSMRHLSSTISKFEAPRSGKPESVPPCTVVMGSPPSVAPGTTSLSYDLFHGNRCTSHDTQGRSNLRRLRTRRACRFLASRERPSRQVTQASRSGRVAGGCAGIGQARHPPEGGRGHNRGGVCRRFETEIAFGSKPYSVQTSFCLVGPVQEIEIIAGFDGRSGGTA